MLRSHASTIFIENKPPIEAVLNFDVDAIVPHVGNLFHMAGSVEHQFLWDAADVHLTNM